MYTTVLEAKKHLLVDEYFTDDDVYILGLIDAAEEAVSKHINRDFDDLAADTGQIPSAVKSAVLYLVGTLYANRESVAYTSAVKVPHTYDYLIMLYKDYSGRRLKQKKYGCSNNDFKGECEIWV